MTILIDIPGKPIPFKAPQVYQSRTFNPRHAEKDQVQDIIRKQYGDALLDAPLNVRFTFFVQIPVSFSKKKVEAALSGEIFPVTRPDASNMVKFYEDCLIGTVIEDDSLIVVLCAYKLYAVKPSTVIQIEIVKNLE